jgi:hypothetical protein
MQVEKHTCRKQIEIRLQLVSRKLTPAQVDAGKRLFKKLIERAQLKGGGDERG